MSDRICAYIRIGGTLPQAQLCKLLDAITAAEVMTEWGDAVFEPKTAEDLKEAMRDGHVWLCDEEARCGEFPELERTCRNLNLGYCRSCEGQSDWDPELVDWRPGMNRPVVRIGSNAGRAVHVSDAEVRRALRHLESGRVGRAVKLLKRLCPEVPKLPPFVLMQAA